MPKHMTSYLALEINTRNDRQLQDSYYTIQYLGQKSVDWKTLTAFEKKHKFINPKTNKDLPLPTNPHTIINGEEQKVPILFHSRKEVFAYYNDMVNDPNTFLTYYRIVIHQRTLLKCSDPEIVLHKYHKSKLKANG